MAIPEGSVSVHESHTTADLVDGHAPREAQLSDAEASARAEVAAERNRKLGAWVDVGATSLPALLVALGSALAGGITMFVRRRRRG